MLADAGSHEERYRLTGAALGLVSALLALGLGFLWHTQLIFTALTVLLAIPAVLALARPPAAFRADYAGITLGSGRQLPHRPAVFIPLGRRREDHPLPRPQGCQVRRLYLGQRRGRVHRSAAPGGSPGPAARQRAGSRLPGARGRGRGNPGVADWSFLASHTRVLLCIARGPGRAVVFAAIFVAQAFAQFR